MWSELSILALAGLFAGYINAIAGAGSSLTLPALIFTGLDANAANATNRVAVFAQNISALYSLRKSGLETDKRIVWLIPPSMLSAGLGAFVSSMMTDAQLRLAIAIAMVFFLALSFIPSKMTQAHKAQEHPPINLASSLSLIAISFYGGFLQAGVGVLTLLSLSVFHGWPLLRANMIKLTLILFLALTSLFVYWWQGENIFWLRGLILSITTSIGAYVGAKATLKKGERFIKVVVTLCIVGSIFKLIFDVIEKGF